ncbi:N2,N2-dimethylguanosine tRNA methyltransferase [Thamnocephalis sphaerospora]|uniref:tRNA (guanine(26)-N(2))-dimethyltransferase n=1 Tax=Thamnocephalis sphaerospora TaxID=78915 RepID=A0A4P9XP25_9FUNG|nr:N2,N2-dimethylguanosine tRNA methyltransferase [Thamnocephalis sphaerospora]|eukprot:RKP07000.1 N2,N2-dimethylguanosine tRNA methyltransferase [Thamnocephalis sphaerospora]
MSGAPAEVAVVGEYHPITEGKATILFPNTNEVFYNPVQQFNRDMSIAAIKTWGKEYLEQKQNKRKGGASDEAAPSGFSVLEALSATGLRSIRYAKEIESLDYVVANDIEADAVRSIRRNIAHNGLTEEKVRPSERDACALMYESRDPAKRFDVIDLDPYGSASPFLDGAVQAVADGGLLCITCTDLAILSGSSHPETCFAKYGGSPVRAEFCHEMALRLVLHALQTSAARYKRVITPLASFSIDFYIRMFVRVHTSPKDVKRTASKTSMVYHCTGCKSFTMQALGKVTTDGKNEKFGVSAGPAANGPCEHCGHTLHVGGPFWGAAIHDADFLSRMLAHVKESKELYVTQPRMVGMLSVASEELDTPFYYTMSSLAAAVQGNNPPIQALFSALLNLGYKVSGSHAARGSLKTNAPTSVVWDVMRTWIKSHPVVEKNIKPTAPAARLLAVEPSAQVDFTVHPKANPDSRKHKLVRYQENPEKYWGPKARAKRARKE